MQILVVIAVISVAALVAIPNIGPISPPAKATRNDHRNAQHLVSMYQSGAAAGVIWNGANRNAKIASVISGQAPTEGPYAGKTFKVSNLSQTEKTSCYKYIGSDANGDLFYDKRGGQPASVVSD